MARLPTRLAYVAAEGIAAIEATAAEAAPHRTMAVAVASLPMMAAATCAALGIPWAGRMSKLDDRETGNDTEGSDGLAVVLERVTLGVAWAEIDAATEPLIERRADKLALGADERKANCGETHESHEDSNTGTTGKATEGKGGTAGSRTTLAQIVDLCARQASSVKELGISAVLSGPPSTTTLAPQNGSGEDHPPIVVHPTTSTSTATFGSEEDGGIVMHAPPGTSTRDCRATQRTSASWEAQDETTVSIPMNRTPATTARELQKTSSNLETAKEEQ